MAHNMGLWNLTFVVPQMQFWRLFWYQGCGAGLMLFTPPQCSFTKLFAKITAVSCRKTGFENWRKHDCTKISQNLVLVVVCIWSFWRELFTCFNVTSVCYADSAYSVGPEFRTWSGSRPRSQDDPEKIQILAPGPDFFLWVFLTILVKWSVKGLDFAVKKSRILP